MTVGYGPRRCGALALVALQAAGCAGGGHRAAPATTASPGPTSTTAVAANTSTSTATGSAATAAGAGAPKVVTVTLAAQNARPHAYRYRLDYPRVVGMPDGAKQAKVDAVIARAAQRAVDAFFGDIKDLPPTPSPTTGPADLSELTGTFETTLLDQRAAAFRINLLEYQAGAAHPSQSVLTFDFDIAAGRRLRLGDLFRPGSPYLTFLSHRARRDLATRPGYDPTFPQDGTAPRASNFALFALTPGALDVTFPAYSVGSGAFGVQTVSIPYTDLRPYAASPGPLDGR